MKNLNKDVAVVTGAARGIGKALVAELLKQGVKKIYAIGKSASITTAFVGNAHVIPMQADVTNAKQIEAVAAKAKDATLIFSNAGVLDFGNILDTPVETIERNFATNFYGQINLAKSFAPVVEKNGGGHFTMLLSVVSLASMPGLAAYNASKAAAWSLAQSLRADLAKKNIQVHSVFPGPVDTDMAAAITFAKTSPEDVAKAIVEGVIFGTEDIFPDAMAQQVYVGWKADHKAMEKNFASM
jgi:NAD(P)-dependent dehydrogenase (short-subunit alcohol dehydrogenase family)